MSERVYIIDEGTRLTIEVVTRELANAECLTIDKWRALARRLDFVLTMIEEGATHAHNV